MSKSDGWLKKLNVQMFSESFTMYLIFISLHLYSPPLLLSSFFFSFLGAFCEGAAQGSCCSLQWLQALHLGLASSLSSSYVTVTCSLGSFNFTAFFNTTFLTLVLKVWLKLDTMRGCFCG